jgi:hypothetical protein
MRMKAGGKLHMGGLLTALILMVACVGPPKEKTQAWTVVAEVLDDWHDAAAQADESRYLEHFAPEAVFLGTDATERWTLEEFTDYVQLYFPKGGWTYHPRCRHVRFAQGGTHAWVDELLDNEKYGTLRGTAVLQLIDGRWRIAHYSMTFAVPNERAAAVVEVIGGE